MRRARGVFVTCLFALSASVLWPGLAHAQEQSTPPDTVRPTVLELRDGTRLIGRVTGEWKDSLRLETARGVQLVLTTDISHRRMLARGATLREDGIWHASQGSRLYFAPTGRMLDVGEGYASSHWIFLLSGTVGVAPAFTLGGGASLLPLDDFTDNLVFITPKVGVVRRENLNVAVGAFAGATKSGSGTTAGLLYTVATFGPVDGSVSVGVGHGFVDGRFADRPVIMLGGEKRVSKRIALITENYGLPKVDGVLLSYGLRFIGETLSADLAFGTTTDGGPWPGVPLIGAAFKF